MKQDNEILSCKNIIKSYPMGSGRLDVLKGVDMSIGRGEFVAIVGSSGSGKSTLLHILGALDRADSGEVFFEGSRLGGFCRKRLNEFRNKKVGFVFQFYHLLDELTVLENILLARMVSMSSFGWFRGAGGAKKEAIELLERLGLGERAGHKSYELSGGERQRVAIGRALINGPQLLLADEPTGNLDSETGNGILKIFKGLHESGQSIVMVTHDEKIASMADRTIRLSDGMISPGS